MLGDFVPDWHLPPIREFLKSIPFFTYLDEKTIDALLTEAKEIEFERDHKIIRVYLSYLNYIFIFFKEQEKATDFYIITRGCGVESSSVGHYKEKKGVGASISLINIIQSDFKYQTSINKISPFLS